MKPNWRRRLLNALRLLGLAAFVGYFFRQRALFDGVWAALRAADLGCWLAGTLSLLLALALNAWRLQHFVLASGYRVSWLTLFVDVVRGTALNAVTLMGVGDGYRAHRLAQLIGGPLKNSVALVFVDRAVGLTLLALVGGAVLLVQGRELRFDWPLNWDSRWLLAAAGLLVLGGALAWAARHRGRVTLALAPVSKRQAHWVIATGTGLLGVGCWLISIYFLTQSLALQVDLATLAWVGPLVTLATLLPISVGGLGVRETGYALLLPTQGGDTGRAAALGLLQYSTFLVVALLGVVLLLRERRQ